MIIDIYCWNGCKCRDMQRLITGFSTVCVVIRWKCQWHDRCRTYIPLPFSFHLVQQNVTLVSYLLPQRHLTGENGSVPNPTELPTYTAFLSTTGELQTRGRSKYLAAKWCCLIKSIVLASISAGCVRFYFYLPPYISCLSEIKLVHLEMSIFVSRDAWLSDKTEKYLLEIHII